MSVQNYSHNVREHHSETITRLVWGLRPKIRHAITGSYDLDTVEEAFNVALKIDLTFKILVNVKPRYSQCEGYRHYDYQCPSESQHVRTVPNDDVDDLKVIEVVYIPSKTASIIEDISVDSNTQIIEKSYVSYEDTSGVVGTKVESGTPLDVDAHAQDSSMRLN